MEGGKNYDGRSAATIYSRKSDAPRNESLKVSWAGYVVSYLQASKERGGARGFGMGLCANNYPAGRAGCV